MKIKDRITSKNNNSGITLIALVITIVVLLILAGVAIASLTGENGLLERASRAKDETEVAQEKEQLLIEVYGSYDKNGDLDVGTLDENIKRHINGVTTDGEGKTIFPLTVTYTETGNVYIIDGEGNVEKKAPVKLPQGLQVGSSVTYAPTGGTYNWEAQYASSDLATDGTKDVNLYSTASGTGTNMRQTSWKVFKIDENTGQVQLVPSKSIGSRFLRLQGAQGYNNAVQLLDGACSALYSQSNKGITARSIDMDDIEPLLDQSKLQTAKNRYNHYESSRSYLNSNDQLTNPYTSNKYFPRIYEEENKSVINGNEKYNGLGLSALGNKLYSREEATLLTGQTTNTNATSGYLEATTNIQPYQTHYYWKDALYTIDNYANSTTASAYSAMLTNNFWVATRCVDVSEAFCNFYVRYVSKGHLNVNIMYDSANRPGDGDYTGLFPIVTLSASLISADGDDFKVDL